MRPSPPPIDLPEAAIDCIFSTIRDGERAIAALGRVLAGGQSMNKLNKLPAPNPPSLPFSDEQDMPLTVHGLHDTSVRLLCTESYR